jgi:hypothetical protein
MLLSAFLLIVLTIAQPCTPVTHVEWREMDTALQTSYLRATQCLKNTSSTLDVKIASPSAFDDLVYSHWKAGPDVHSTAPFLPWHRLVLHYHDNLIRSKCGYSGPMPYWDWSLDSQQLDGSPVLTAFGGDGRSGDDCLSEGPFASFAAVFPEKQPCITRRLGIPREETVGQASGVAYSPSILQYVHSAAEYNEFRKILEDLPHNT